MLKCYTFASFGVTGAIGSRTSRNGEIRTLRQPRNVENQYCTGAASHLQVTPHPHPVKCVASSSLPLLSYRIKEIFDCILPRQPHAERYYLTPNTLVSPHTLLSFLPRSYSLGGGGGSPVLNLSV
jgi:hypothetical protein